MAQETSLLFSALHHPITVHASMSVPTVLTPNHQSFVGSCKVDATTKNNNIHLILMALNACCSSSLCEKLISQGLLLMEKEC